MCEILGVVVNTLTTNDKYPVRDCENLLLPIQRQLSLKKNFFWIFGSILESTSSFKHYVKKDDLHSYSFSEITDFERLV